MVPRFHVEEVVVSDVTLTWYVAGLIACRVLPSSFKEQGPPRTLRNPIVVDILSNHPRKLIQSKRNTAEGEGSVDSRAAVYKISLRPGQIDNNHGVIVHGAEQHRNQSWPALHPICRGFGSKLGRVKAIAPNSCSRIPCHYA